MTTIEEFMKSLAPVHDLVTEIGEKIVKDIFNEITSVEIEDNPAHYVYFIMQLNALIFFNLLLLVKNFNEVYAPHAANFDEIRQQLNTLIDRQIRLSQEQYDEQKH